LPLPLRAALNSCEYGHRAVSRFDPLLQVRSFGAADAQAVAAAPQIKPGNVGASHGRCPPLRQQLQAVGVASAPESSRGCFSCPLLET